MKRVILRELIRAVLIQLKGHDAFPKSYFMSCRFTLLPPFRLYGYKGKMYASWQNHCQSARKLNDSSWCLTKYITDSARQVSCWGFTHVNTWIQTFSHIYPCIHTHARTHVDTHTRTYPIQYSSRHKRGKTGRHGCLSKQLQQTETKLNLKPRATLATECLWQIWQGRKGSAAGPKGGRHDEENARCGSERKRKLLG